MERAASSGSSAAHKRLMQDMRAIKGDESVIAQPLDDDLFHWTATIPGPDDTPWEGGLFQLDMKFTESYPNDPPNVKFLSEGIYHPNVYVDGRICLDILKTNWSPNYDVRTLLVSIQSLLAEPNPASAANPEAAEVHQKNPAEYKRRVKAAVEASIAAMEGALGDEDDDDDEA